MTTAYYLKMISDEQGPLQGSAAESMERFEKKDFLALMRDMQELVDYKAMREAADKLEGKTAERSVIINIHSLFPENANPMYNMAGAEKVKEMLVDILNAGQGRPGKSKWAQKLEEMQAAQQAKTKDRHPKTGERLDHE